MGLLSALGKLGDIVMKPIELLTDWGREPLKKWDHERDRAQVNAESQNRIREIERDRVRVNAESQNRIREMNEESAIREREMNAESQNRIREIERDRVRVNAESQNRIRVMNEESAIREREKKLEVDLSIKKETEIKKIFIELEEFKKDKELQRMIAVSEAIMKYQQELTKLNVNAINAIGNMQLDLREKAQQLVYDKTIKYKKLQDQAINEAVDDLKRIDSDFSDNDVAKNILIRAIDKRLANIIDTAHNFLLELNADIKLLNQSINILTEHGQTFIESHLEKFHVIEPAMDAVKQIEDKNT